MVSSAAVLSLLLGIVLPAAQASSASPAPGRDDPAVVGSWGSQINVGVVAIHAAVLYTGKVLLYGKIGDGPGSEAQVFDPATETVTDVDVPFESRDVFCSGLSTLPDGRLFINGGHLDPLGHQAGADYLTTFDPATSTWSVVGSLAVTRWYPTNVSMPDGTTLIFGGQIDGTTITKKMESYNPTAGTITTLPVSKRAALYPRAFVLPDGHVFMAGQPTVSSFFDPATNTWTDSASMSFRHTEGSWILLPGLQKVLVAGGVKRHATNTVETIDLSQPNPQWVSTAPLNLARLDANLVTLPDGTDLLVGGGSGGQYTNPVKTAELYDPSSDTWTEMAPQSALRIYHSTAVLLPDGRVLSAGSDSGLPEQYTAEIYSPPYLFHGVRPSIVAAPPTTAYGAQMTITTLDAATIAKVTLLRLGTSTHATDMEQRYLELPFVPTEDGTGVVATAPANANIAPPGYYLMFLVNSAGVPSVAATVQVMP